MLQNLTDQCDTQVANNLWIKLWDATAHSRTNIRGGQTAVSEWLGRNTMDAITCP